MTVEKEALNLIKKYVLSKKPDIDFETIDKSKSLISTGVLDSLDFIEILSEFENLFNVEIDFEDSDPEVFTTVNGLISLAESNSK